MRITKNTAKICRMQETDSLICNKCGKNFKNNNKNMFWSNLIHTIYITFGYGSKRDMTSITFELCEECIEDVISSFKHPVKVINKIWDE